MYRFAAPKKSHFRKIKLSMVQKIQCCRESKDILKRNKQQQQYSGRRSGVLSSLFRGSFAARSITSARVSASVSNSVGLIGWKKMAILSILTLTTAPPLSSSFRLIPTIGTISGFSIAVRQRTQLSSSSSSTTGSGNGNNIPSNILPLTSLPSLLPLVQHQHNTLPIWSTASTSMLSTPSSSSPSSLSSSSSSSSSSSTTRLGSVESRELRFFNGEDATITTTIPASASKAITMSDFQKIHNLKIELTNEEDELFTLLNEVLEANQLSSTLRIAGGWVRDKLLATGDFHHGHQHADKYDGNSKPLSIGTSVDTPMDIDIALDDMLGREFAILLNSHLEKSNNSTTTSISSSNMGIILANPEKSKHLETAAIRIGNCWIDLVNLRAESYIGDSRIPDLVRIGTPEEDAFRRDLTINALFYNLRTRKVEDPTGRGLLDLYNGIVSTPLQDPLMTLLDDPLRVLRSVRFTSRFGFTMDEPLKLAARDGRVHTALKMKVARERIGSEINNIMRCSCGLGVVYAFKLLLELELACTVFPVAKEVGGEDVLRRGLNEGMNLLTEVSSHGSSTLDDIMASLDNDMRRILRYATFLKPLTDISRHCYGCNNEDNISKVNGDDANNIIGNTLRRKLSRGGGGGRGIGRGRIVRGNSKLPVRLLVDVLKRPRRDASTVLLILDAADDFTDVLEAGGGMIAESILMGSIRVEVDRGVRSETEKTGIDGDCMIKATTTVNSDDDDDSDNDAFSYHFYKVNSCWMRGEEIDVSVEQDDPVWKGAMEFRANIGNIVEKAGPLWRAGLSLSLAEGLVAAGEEHTAGDADKRREQRRDDVIQQYNVLEKSISELGLDGIWLKKPIIDGDGLTSSDVLPNLPKGPAYREVLDEQSKWTTTHPGGKRASLVDYLRKIFPKYV